MQRVTRNVSRAAIAIAVSLTLSACSVNVSRQPAYASGGGGSQVAGAITGGLIGGAVGSQFGKGKGRTGATLLGAGLGSMVGARVTASPRSSAAGRASYDRESIAEAHMAAFQGGRPVSWSGVESRGTVLPGPVYRRGDGNTCRRYEARVQSLITGKAHRLSGQACRGYGGVWQVV